MKTKDEAYEIICDLNEEAHAATYDAWVGVICLNQTNRKQVKRVLPMLFGICPTPMHLINTTPETIKMIIRPLGMVNVRENRLRRMSNDYLTWDGNDATVLHGIGKYGSDSYRLFYKNEIPDNIGDHELKRYVEEELNGNLCTS
jgi:methyl-CpG-binding domain protein 4